LKEPQIRLKHYWAHEIRSLPAKAPAYSIYKWKPPESTALMKR